MPCSALGHRNHTAAHQRIRSIHRFPLHISYTRPCSLTDRPNDQPDRPLTQPTENDPTERPKDRPTDRSDRPKDRPTRPTENDPTERPTDQPTRPTDPTERTTERPNLRVSDLPAYRPTYLLTDLPTDRRSDFLPFISLPLLWPPCSSLLLRMAETLFVFNSD